MAVSGPQPGTVCFDCQLRHTLANSNLKSCTKIRGSVTKDISLYEDNDSSTVITVVGNDFQLGAS